MMISHVSCRQILRGVVSWLAASLVLTVSVASAQGPQASSQSPFNVAIPVDRQLASLFSNLYGPNGLIVNSLAVLPSGDTHSAHFNSDFQSNFVQFGTALASRLVSIPLPSPASGFTYEFDPSLGVFSRTTDSFGPILAERADTIGENRLSVGFAFQRFTFDTIENLDLNSVPAVFTHDSFELRGGRDDVVTTRNAIDARVSQATAFLTYGVTNRLDVSIGVPIISTSLTVVSEATVQRLGTTGSSEVHFFRGSDDLVGDRRVFTAFGNASGLGDITVRLKGTLTRNGPHGLGLGLDLRLPTGNEQQLLGSGAPGVRPFFIWSMARPTVSPHVNAGYLWNGSSVLAGNPATGESADMSDQVFYTVGADMSVGSRLTLAFDVLGRILIDAPRIRQERFMSPNGVDEFSNIRFVNDTFSEHDGAIGIKLNLAGELLLDVNVLFRLDNNGLRDKVTPFVGLEYAM